MTSPAIHLEPVRVRWADGDSMGHVNNAKYFTYCESARMSYFAAVGLEAFRQGGRFGPALAAASLNFRRQVRYPAELTVRTRVSKLGRTSFTMDYEIVEAATADRVAGGAGVIVWIDYETGRPEPIPEGLRAAIRGYAGPEGERADGAEAERTA
jgi:acyl-CoA thioester hydrolase